MAVALRATATASSDAASSTVSVVAPASVVAGDMLLMVVTTNVATTTISTPAGWTQHGATTSDSTCTSAVFRKSAVAGDAGATVSSTLSTAYPWAVVLAAFSGVGGFDSSAAPVSNGASSTTVNTPSITTVAANAVAVAFYSARQAGSGTGVAVTLTTAAGTTLAGSVGTTRTGAAPNFAAQIVYSAPLPAGTVTPTYPATASVSVLAVGAQIALAPAAATDTTAPTITFATPPDGAVYTTGRSVLASYSAADNTGGSGLAAGSPSGTVASGAAIDTATAGAKSFTVTATDVAGNTASVTHTYTVNAPQPPPPAGGMTWPTLTVEAQLTPGVWTDIGPYVLAASTHRGRQYEVGTVDAGTATLVLDNADGRFTPGSASGPYGANVVPGVVVRVKAVQVTAGTFPLFYGVANAWTQTHPGGSAYATVQLLLSDPLAALGRINLPGIASAMLLDTPDYLYGLQEAAGSLPQGPGGTLLVGDLTPNGVGATTASPDHTGTLTFGNAGPYGRTAATWTRDAAGRGPIIYRPAEPTPTSLSWEAWINPDTLPAGGIFAAIIARPGIYGLYVVPVGATQQVVVGTSPQNGSVGVALMPGGWHQVVVTVTAGGMPKLYFDGVLVGTGQLAAPAGAAWAAVASDIMGTGANNSGAFTGSMALVARYPFELTAARVLAHYNGITGVPGELADARIARYLGYGGVTLPQLFDAGLTPLQPDLDTPRTLLDLIRATEHDDGGTFYAKPDGTLRYETRRTRLDTATSATLNPANGNGVEADLTWTLDDTHIVNDAQITQTNGPIRRYQSVASISTYGTRSEADTIASLTADEALYRAEAHVSKNAHPVTRASMATLNAGAKGDDTLWATALGLDLAAAVTIAGLPSTAPASSVPLVVESVDHVVTPNAGWLVQFQTSPYSLATAWKLEDARYGALDTVTNPLAW